MSNNLTHNLNESAGEKLDRLIAAAQSIDNRLTSVDTSISSLDTRLTTFETGITSLDTRLMSLETKVDQRLHDTQPIWETVLAQLQQHREILQQHSEILQRLDGEVTGLRGEVASLRADTEKGFRTIDRRMERQIGEFERLHAYQRDLEDRVDRIEKLSNP